MAVQISGNDITVPRDGSFTRNVTIGGTLTYEDVTNIDSVGLITARTGIEIGARPGVAASISVDGNMIISGISTFGGDIQVPDKIIHSGDTDTAIRFPATNYVSIESAGVEKVEFRPSEVTFNDTGMDCDFRIEGDSNDNLFKVDAGNDRIGVGLAAPQQVFHVYHASDNGLALFESGDANCRIDLKDNSGQASVEAIGDALRFGTSSSNTERARIDSSGRLLLGHTAVGSKGAASPLQIQTANSGAFAVTIRNRSSNNDYGFIGFTDDDADEDLCQIGVQRTAANTADIFFYTNGGASGSTERLRIDSSGRLLLGLTSSRGNYGNNTSGVDYKMQIEGTGATTSSLAIIRNSDDANDGGIILGKTRATSVGGNTVVQAGDDIGTISFVGADGTSLQFGADIGAEVESGVGDDDMPTSLYFKTNGGTTSTTEHMRITSGGDIRMGTADASIFGEKIRMRSGQDKVILNIDSASTGTAAAVVLRHARGGLSGFSGTAFSFVGNDSTQEGSIVIHTTSTAYNTTSDYRLKENEVAISDGITRLKQLKPYQFNFKKDPGVKVDGFFAHEVSSVVPFSVTGDKDAVKDDGSIVPQGMDHSKLVPLLTAALQETITEIESLKTEVAALKSS